MYYVIQENLFKERNYKTLLNTMHRFNFEYDVVKYLPYLDDLYENYDREIVGNDFEPVLYKTDRKDIFCFGAVNMAIAAKKRGWEPGSMVNDNHDYSVYAPRFGFENMLNGEGIVINFTDPLPFEDEYIFARPTKDTKAFVAKVYSRGEWNDYVKGAIGTDSKKVLSEETQVLIAYPKNIQQEVRCWVVGGKVVTASRYKIGHQVIYANYDHESFFVDFAQSMADKFQVAEAFVIDVCLADDELKVVEVNNINSAGFYEANMTKLIEALEEHFNK